MYQVYDNFIIYAELEQTISYSIKYTTSGKTSKTGIPFHNKIKHYFYIYKITIMFYSKTTD